MRLIVRQAKPGEYEKIVDLYKKEGPAKRIRKIRRDVKKNFEEMKKGKRMVLFAEANGKVIGTVQLVFQLKDRELADGKKVANLHHLRVKEEFRNRGIATKLEEALIKIAKKRGFRIITLGIKHDQSYDFLRKLYEGWGYFFLKENPKKKETCFYKKIV